MAYQPLSTQKGTGYQPLSNSTNPQASQAAAVPAPQKQSGGFWNGVKSIFGFGGNEQPAAPAPTAPVDATPGRGTTYVPLSKTQAAPLAKDAQPQKVETKPFESLSTKPLLPQLPATIRQAQEEAKGNSPEVQAVRAAYPNLPGESIGATPKESFLTKTINALKSPFVKSPQEKQLRDQAVKGIGQMFEDDKYEQIGKQLGYDKTVKVQLPAGVDARTVDDTTYNFYKRKALVDEVKKNFDSISKQYTAIDATTGTKTTLTRPTADYNAIDKNFTDYTKAIGLRGNPTPSEVIQGLATFPVVAGLISNPIGTIIGVAGWEALSRAEHGIFGGEISTKLGEKLQLNEPTQQALDLLELFGKGKLLHGVYLKSPSVAEQFVRKTTIQYNLPKTIYIDPVKVKDIFQTGEKISAEEANMIKQLGLTGEQYREAIKNGISIQIPTEKVVNVADRPYWTKFKQALGFEPVNDTTRTFEGGKPTEGVRGLIEGPSGEPITAQGTVNEVPKLATEINDKIKLAYQNSGPSDQQGFSKADEHLSQIYTELELAKPGERVITGLGADRSVTGVSSTFPEWIPEHLRRSDLIAKVLPTLDSLENLQPPPARNTAQRALYNAILDELDSRSGVDTKQLRENLNQIYEKQNPNAEVDSSGARGGRQDEINAEDVARDVFGPEPAPKDQGQEIKVPKRIEEQAASDWEQNYAENHRALEQKFETARRSIDAITPRSNPKEYKRLSQEMAVTSTDIMDLEEKWVSKWGKTLDETSARTTPKTPEEAADTYWNEVMKPRLESGKALIIGGDDLKDFFGNDYNDKNHPIYSKAAFQLYVRALKENPGDVAFSGGGAGSGKTEIIIKQLANTDFSGIIYDSNMSNYQGAVDQIKMAKDAGREVRIYGITPNLDSAYKFTILRQNEGGHGISEKTFARGHAGFPEVAAKLVEDGVVDKNNVFILDTREPNTLEEVKARFLSGDFTPEPVAHLRKLGYTEENVRENYKKELFDSRTGQRLQDASIRVRPGETSHQSGANSIGGKERQGTQTIFRSEVNSALGFNPKNLEEPESSKASGEVDKAIKRSDIAKYISEKLDVPIRNGKFRQKALGIFKPDSMVVRHKSGSLNTKFHEITHYLDYKFGKLSGKIIDKSEITSLLTEYAKENLPPHKEVLESFAELGRYYMTGQMDKIEKRGPKSFKAFSEWLDSVPEVKDVLETARADYKRWLDMPATAKVFSQIAIGEDGKGKLSTRITNSIHNIYTQSLDDLHPLSEFSKIARETNPELKAEDDPYILARNLRGWIGRADTFLKQGTFGKNFYKEEGGKIKPNYKGKSFEAIVKPIEAKGALNDFRTYIVAQRSVELADRGIKTGIAKGDAQAALDELNKNFPQFEKAAADLYKYQNNLLEYAHEHGLVTEQNMQLMQELNKFRVPFYRVMEEMQFMGGNGKTIGNNKAPIKKIKGSERDIIDPLESIVKDTYAMINAADRNAVAVAMARLSFEDYRLGRLVEHVPPGMQVTKVSVQEVLQKAFGPMYEAFTQNQELPDAIVNIFRPAMYTKPGEISVMIDGKRKVFEVDKDIYKAIQGLNTEDVALVVKILSYPAAFLRAGATLTPDFILRNPLRDQFSAFVYSKAGFLPGIDLVRGMYEVLTNGDAFQLWKIAGGESATMVSIDRPGIQKTLKEVLASKGQALLSYIKNPLKTLQIVSQFTEQATRIGEMKKVLAKTGNPTEAAFASREVTLDFNRIGAKTKAMNLITAFWNANVQGTDKMIREFRQNPGKSMMKTILAITLPSILLYYANRKDPRWKEIPQWQKNLFWIVMTEKHIYRIPKPFELGVLFGSLPERVLESIDTNDPKLFDELEKSVTDGLSPGFIPTGILPIIENMTNYSFFLDRPLIPRGKESLPPEAQFGSQNSDISKILGEAFGWSPAKIDNLIHGYFAGLGDYTTKAVDGLLEGTGVVHKPPAPTKQDADIPVLRAFVVRDPKGSGSESVNRFYDLYGSATAGESYIKALVKQGDNDKAKKYLTQHPEVEYARELTAVANTLADIRKAVDEIERSTKLSPDEKRRKIDKGNTMITDLARKTVESINQKQKTSQK